MTNEEKAKAYDEALKRAKEINNEQRAQPFNLMTKLFPELAESEDERIRKEMIEILKKETHEFPSSVIANKSNSWIAWLEKQKMIDILDEEEKEFAEDADAIRKMCDEAYQNGYNEGRRIEKEIWLEKQGDIVKQYEDKLDKCACYYFNKGYKKALEKQGEKNDYNPYKATVESIVAMVEKYAPFDANLQDFYDNVKIKCKDAVEYDKKH